MAEQKQEKEVKQPLKMLVKLQKMRVALIERDIEMTGENKYSNYKYFQLADFLPHVQKIMLNEMVTAVYELTSDKAVLTLINLEDFDDRVSFSLPTAEAGVKGASGIQQIGAQSTYLRRYLYMNAFEISENDIEDESKPQEDDKKKIEDIKNAPISPAKVATIMKQLERTGIKAEQIVERYHVETIESITEELYPRVFEALKKTPDKK